VAHGAFTIRILRERREESRELVDLQFQLKRVADEIELRLGRELFVVSEFDSNGRVIAVVNSFLRGIPQHICSFDVHTCLYVEAEKGSAKELPWREALENLLEHLRLAVEAEAQSLHARSVVARTQITPYFALEELDQLGETAGLLRIQA
jgi:hypothetical protein